MKETLGVLLIIGLFAWLLLSFPGLWYVVGVLAVLAIIGWCFD